MYQNNQFQDKCSTDKRNRGDVRKTMKLHENTRETVKG